MRARDSGRRRKRSSPPCEEAFTPVYAALRRDHETAGYLDEIEALKASTPGDPALDVPAECAAVPSSGDGDEGTAPRELNGVYRYTLTHEDAVAAGQGDDPEYPMTQTWWLESGAWRASGGSTGDYRVDGDQITFRVDRAVRRGLHLHVQP